MKVRDFSKLYLGLLALCLAVTYRPHSDALYLISKPALAFSLLAFFIHFTKGQRGLGRQFIILALGTSLAGDILLMQKGDAFFLIGMACFTLAQIAYSAFYANLKLSFRIGPVLLSLIVPALALWALWEFGKIPNQAAALVYGYAALLGLHFVMSVWQAAALGAGAWKPALGAFLFLLSGLLLAYARFNDGVKYQDLLIMLTYGAAQFLVVTGLLFHWPSQEED